jgi:RNA polymerase sigma-54 factor
MKPSLQLKLSQSLTMTPQLQQAIRLLQLSSLELQTEIQNALDSNMMLEVDEGEAEEEAYVQETKAAASDDETSELELKDNIDNADIPDELPVDTAWDDIYDGNLGYDTGGPASGNEFLENREIRESTLADHLLWQLNLLPIGETDRAIAITIIDVLDKDGYLTCALEDILPMLDEEMDAGIEEVNAVLRLIQSMEPTGVGARDLKECLGLQLAQYSPATPWLDEARRLLQNHMDLLAAHDYNQLARKMSLDRGQLSEVVALIQTLNPRPGSKVQDESIHYITPDVYVKKDRGHWKVELNAESTPRLRINSAYASMIKRADYSPANNSLKEHLQEARWLIKSLQSRSETLLKVATSIVERQRQFLEHGEAAMRPLVLHDIAKELGMHESTISRVTTRKYMHTPRGIFELKYFFSSHVNTDDGGAASSTAIRAVIKKLVGEEDQLKPLSDSKIARILAEQGIKVARRTVAKYREAMAIPPSNERKRLV